MRTDTLSKLAVAALGAGSLVLATACGAGGQPSQAPVEDVATRLDTLAAEAAAHRDAVDQATDLNQVGDAEVTWLDEMRRFHDGLDHDMGDLAACGQAMGEIPESMHGHMEAMVTSAHDLEAAVRAHEQAMLDATGMDEAHAEEARHQAWVDDALARMRSMHGELEAQWGGQPCEVPEGEGDGWHMGDGGHMGDDESMRDGGHMGGGAMY